MALIRNSKPKKVSGGYHRLFRNNAVGDLMSRVHSAVVSSGCELEKIIIGSTQQIEDVNRLLEKEPTQDGVFVVSKKVLKASKLWNTTDFAPDFVVFVRRSKKLCCYIVELKDGDSFDTKKSGGEGGGLRKFAKKNASRLPGLVGVRLCCFNQNDRNEIVKGFKRRINIKEAMTGREFCELLELDYDQIVKLRKKSVRGNLPYFLSELIKTPAVKKWLNDHFDK